MLDPLPRPVDLRVSIVLFGRSGGRRTIDQNNGPFQRIQVALVPSSRVRVPAVADERPDRKLRFAPIQE